MVWLGIVSLQASHLVVFTESRMQMSGTTITPRMRQILTVLLEEEQPVSVKRLAEQIGMSRRTVQRELESVRSALKGYEIQFVSKTGVGIHLEGDKTEKERLLLEISESDPYDAGNREERRKRLILEILKEKGLRKLFYYSSQFGVSEATISSDLEAVESWLVRYGLRIQKKPGSGILIEGSEEDYRKAIRAFISENIDTKVLREAYEGETDVPDRRDALKKSEIGQLLNDEIVRRVIDCIAGMDNSCILTLTENSYVGLVIHISIAVNRILKDEVIEPKSSAQTEYGNLTEADEDYLLAKQIVHELEEEFEIEIPDVEISYICLHIKGAKHEKIQWDDRRKIPSDNRELRQMVNQMIDLFDPDKAYHLKQDEEFIQGLLAHLQPTLIRLVHGMQIRNPVLDEIKINYRDIYERCVRVASVLEEAVGKLVPEEEIGFLAVHFGAAAVRLEGRGENIRKVSVGVVCSSGIGISRLMTSKLEKAFKDRMTLTAYGKSDITAFVAGKTDFFVSSIPLEQTDVPVIYVNPLLSDADMDEIRRMTYEYERMPKKQGETDEFTLQLETINQTAAQINLVIRHMEFFKVSNGITFEDLLIAVAEKISPYADRRDMIQQDLMRRERISSQIFAEFDFALLHTRTAGVTRPTFAVCMTRDLSEYTDPYFKGIHVVFVMLVPPDDLLQINSEIMGYISSMLIEEEEFLDTVRRGEKEEIRSLLSKYLKRYFKKYLAGLS